MSPALSVVIPNFNGSAVLPRCLASLAVQTVAPLEVLVVDNGSIDGSAEAVERDFPTVRVLRVGHNSGFGAAANLGVAESTGRLVSILNSDARPEPTWVATMTAFVEPTAWSWGGLLISATGQVESAGDCYSMAGFAYKHAQGEPRERIPSEPYEVFAPPGAAPVFRRDVLLELGGYDSRYFLYLEDIDLAFRARSRGHTSWVIPTVAVEHDLGGSGTSEIATWHIARNAVWCHVANAPALNPRLFAATTVRELREARQRSAALPYLRGRAAALSAIPRLLRQRREELRARTVDGSALVRMGMLPGALPPR